MKADRLQENISCITNKLYETKKVTSYHRIASHSADVKENRITKVTYQPDSQVHASALDQFAELQIALCSQWGVQHSRPSQNWQDPYY